MFNPKKLLNKPRFNKRSGVWEIRFSNGTDPHTGKRRRPIITHKTKAGVQAKAIEFIESQRKEQPQSSGMTLRDYLLPWYERGIHAWEPRTQELYLHLINDHLLPSLGHMPLEDIKSMHVGDMMAQMAAKDIAVTANQSRRLLGQALDDALNDELIRRNPVKSVKRVKEHPREMVLLTSVEIRTLLDATRNNRLYAAFHLLVASGVRRGELLGLQWKDVTDSGIHIRRNLKMVGNQPVLGDVKTKNSKRFIDLGPDTLEVLHRHREIQLSEAKACLGSWYDSGFVFTSKIGTPIFPRNLLRTVKNEQKKAGVTVTSVHAFRHTHASQLIAHGVDIKTISMRLGHSSTSFTLDRYGHILQEHRHRAALTVSDLLGE